MVQTEQPQKISKWLLEEKKNSTQTLFQLIYVNLLILLSENDQEKLYPINTVTIFMYARDKLNSIH